MVYFLYGLFFLSCIVLVAAVLLQPGKTDAGALFTSNVSSSAFTPRGTATVLSKITIVAAAVFMLSGLFLAMPALTGDVSVLSSNPGEAATANANANTANANTADANANTASNTGTNANSPAGSNANSAAPAVNSAANATTVNAPAGNSTTVNVPAGNEPAKPGSNK